MSYLVAGAPPRRGVVEGARVPTLAPARKHESDHAGRFRMRHGRPSAGCGNQAKFFAAKSQLASLSRKVATKSGRRLR